MSDRITTCPVEGCGAELQATAVRYLSRVALDAETRRIVAYEPYGGNDPDGHAWDHEACRVYCENDHELPGWRAPHARPDGWAELGGFGTVPNPITQDGC